MLQESRRGEPHPTGVSSELVNMKAKKTFGIL
jgi:hypothetical protein